ncbi:MAG: hypothetical protein JXB00_03655 [Bacteroidales bacterium]|nr:hypothetical protein [Bacteroidales bacterium]
MTSIIKIYSNLFAIIVLVILVSSCKKEEASNEEIVNRELYGIMKDLYLWYDKLPVINPSDYSTPGEMMTALRYKPLDRWSFVLSWDEYYQYFQAGEMIGHGFMISQDADNNFRIAFIYPSSSAYHNEVRRGWTIKKINGITPAVDNLDELLGPASISVTNTFTIIDNSNVERTVTLTKELIKINPVLYSSIINIADKKIGYIVFQDFIETAYQELDSVFASFGIEEIDDLILDMRYNGGGNVDVAVHLAGWLTGNLNAGKTLSKILHNSKLSAYDTIYKVPYNNASLDLDRITFIGTIYTASASELVINGMKPFMSTTLVGSATEGKPVGMYVLGFEEYNYAAFPVSFKYTNALDEGDFYDGLQPEFVSNDDLTRDFGDIQEGMLNTALNHLTSGAVPSVMVKKTTTTSRAVIPENNLSVFQRAF